MGLRRRFSQRPRVPQTGVTAVVVYSVIAGLFFALPLLEHPRTTALASDVIESSQFIWFLAWWPDALLAGRDPLHTSFVHVPAGYNLTWTVSMPGPSLLMAPVTRLLGPVVAFNLLSLAAPVVSALAAFVLFRKVSGTFWPAVVGGYVFGFSPYMLGAFEGGSLFLSLVPLIPLTVYLVIRRVEDSIGPRAFIAALAATLAGQFSISAEVLAVTTFLGATVGLAACLLMRQHRSGLLRVLRGALVAYPLAALLVSPILYGMFFRSHLEPTHAQPDEFSSDLLSFAFPTPLVRLGRNSFAGLAETFEGGPFPGSGGFAYLGLPLILIIAAFAVDHWREPVGRLVLVGFAVVAIAALGPKLHVAGVETIRLPWALPAELPLLRYAIPVRFAVFLFLAAGLILTLWLAAAPSRRRWGAAALALVFLFPNLGHWKLPLDKPSFFRDDAYREVLNENDHVLVWPPFGPSVRWQAETEMGFKLAGGWIGAIPPDYIDFYDEAHSPDPDASAIRSFIDEKRVTVVVVARDHEVWRKRLVFLRIEPREIAGVTVYRLRSPR